MGELTQFGDADVVDTLIGIFDGLLELAWSVCTVDVVGNVIGSGSRPIMAADVHQLLFQIDPNSTTI